MDESKQQTENWAVVISAGSKYVGNVIKSTPTDGQVWVELNPCYEYMSDLQIAQGPSPGQLALAGRTKILVPYDHTLIPCPVLVRVDTITYMDDMAPEDAKGYMEAVKVAKDMADGLRRKRDTSLVLVPASAMPKGDPRRAT